MKKLSLLILTLFITISATVAQQGLFVRASGNANTTKSSLLPTNKREAFDASRVAGYTVGLGYRSEMCKFLNFEHELQFSQEGLKYDEENLDLKMLYLRYSHLVSLPICSNFNLLMGPSVGYKLNEQVSQNNSDFFEPIADSKKNFDTGINIGVRFNIGNFHLYTRAYQAVFNSSNMTVTDENGNSTKVKEFNHNVQIGAGYTF